MNNTLFFDANGLKATAFSGSSINPMLVAGIAISLSSTFGLYPAFSETPMQMTQKNSWDNFGYRGVESQFISSVIINQDRDLTVEQSKTQDDYFGKLLEALNDSENSIAIPLNQTEDEFIDFINAL